MIIIKQNIAIVIINSKGEVLFIRRNKDEESMPDMWELPSGGIDKGESKEDCVIREAKEETGINLNKEKIKLADTEKYSFQTQKGDIKKITEYTFLCKLDNTPKVILNKEEHYQFKWINPQEVDSLFDDKKDIILKRIKRIF